MTHIQLLITLLSQSKIYKQSTVHELPSPEKEDIGAVYQDLKSIHLTGQDAFEKYSWHISNVKLNKNRVGLMSVRVPGCLIIETNEEQEIRERIEVINTLKKSFDDLIKHQGGKNKDERFEIVSQAVPDLVRKALSRQILVSPKYTSNVSYAWSNSTSISKPLHKDEWDKRLENAIAFKRNHPNAKNWQTAIEIERSTLRAITDTDFFKVKRPLRVVPIMNVKYLSEKVSGIQKKTTYIAHTPLLVINDLPKLSILKNYSGSTKKKLIQEHPVIERLHLYKA
jgi:DNA replication terminus site-binding protein